MLDERDITAVTRAAAGLTVVRRGRRWGHLSLNVLAAVLPREAAVRGYARAAGLRRVSVPGDLLPVPGEEPLDGFLRHADAWGVDHLAAEVLGDTGRTSTRGGILRAEAAVRYARILSDHRILTMADAADLLDMPVRTTVVGRELAGVPGHGGGNRLDRLWRLLADDHQVLLDDATHTWCRSVTGRDLSGPQLRALLRAVAVAHPCTPWELGQAIAADRRPVPATRIRPTGRRGGETATVIPLARWRDLSTG